MDNNESKKPNCHGSNGCDHASGNNNESAHVATAEEEPDSAGTMARGHRHSHTSRGDAAAASPCDPRPRRSPSHRQKQERSAPGVAATAGGGRGGAVKFAIPAEFVAYEPRAHFGGRGAGGGVRAPSSSSSSLPPPGALPRGSNGGNGNGGAGPNLSSGGGAYSSGSLSSMGHCHAAGAGSSSLLLSSDSGGGSHHGRKKQDSSSLLKQQQLQQQQQQQPQVKSLGSQRDFGTQSFDTSTTHLTSNSLNDNLKSPPPSAISPNHQSNNIGAATFSNSQNSGSSGSGSDNNGGATSSSGNAAVVTTSTATCNNNTTSSGSGGSGDDDRSSSGSGRGSGSGSGSGNRRSAGEASGEFYYAGYSSNQATSSVGDNAQVGLGMTPAPQVNGMATGANNAKVSSFTSFQGASLAASNAAAAAGPAQRPGAPNARVANNARHVTVAADGPPTPPRASHHHHSHRHYDNRSNRARADTNIQGQGLPADAAAAGIANQGTADRSGAAMPLDTPAAGAAFALRPLGQAARPAILVHPAASSGGIPASINRPSPAAAPRPQSSQQARSQQVALQQYRGAPAVRHPSRHHRPPPPLSLHHELRLPPPPIDDQAVLQRVPRTHATVVAHDLPPPPTSSDAWSSGSGGSSRSRAAAAATAVAGAGTGTGTRPRDAEGRRGNHHPMVASVRLANGGAVDSVNMSDGSSAPSSEQATVPQPTAMHVTMDDPILRKKIMLKDRRPVPKQPPSSKSEGKKTGQEVAMGVAPGKVVSAKPTKSGTNAKGKGGDSNSAIKRKRTAIQKSSLQAGPNSDDSFDSTKSRSGSDEGYAASSEHQSGSSGSGSDSISSDDANKKDNVVASLGRGGNGGAAGQPGKTGGASAMADTSSMSSSVLADFSSVMNEEGTISLMRSDSPRSSCTSMSSDGDNHDADKTKTEAAKPNSQVAKVAKGSKRDTAHLRLPSTNVARKRSKQSKAAAPQGEHAQLPPPPADAPLDEFGPAGDAMMSGLSIMEKSLQQKARSSTHHHHYHSRSAGRKMLEKSFLSAKRDLGTADAASTLASLDSSARSSTESAVKRGGAKRAMGFKSTGCDRSLSSVMKLEETSFQEACIYSCPVMAQVLQFLEPPEIHSFLTTPLSKAWLVTYTAPQELWKILCTSKPFYAKLDEGSLCEGSNGSSDASTCSFPICNDLEMRHLFGRYRLLYTSFVRCMKYLNRLQDDALNGRTPTGYNSNETQNDIYPYHKNVSLKAYFAKARRLVRSGNHRRSSGGSRSSSNAALSITSESGSGSDKRPKSGTAGMAPSSGSQQQPSRSSSGLRFGRSMLTDRLLRPTQAGDVDNVNLPWSCAIYSVVNWMVAFADVEGIQIMCLKCLPYLLEDESQRTTAQRAGLTDSVLRAMVLFPDSIELHTVAFHTLVLLARPLGGNEGMLFHTAMVNTRGIFNNGSNNSKNGIVIMLDSMRRFAQDEILQAMSCWSLVNVALTPLQKSMLVKLGGLTVTSNAMLQHPYNAEVQFRALFALINLVIPTETRPDETEEMREFEREIFQQLGEVGETSEKEMLDASVGQISNLVVVGMKNFCSSEAILNRACLVLHNLSLNEEYHSTLLWTPNCYQMLEWCIGNYPHDHVLQQSAGGTIQRLNATLSADEELRARFTHSIRAQQQHSLELARQEAVMLQEQQREQEQAQMDIS